MYEYFTALVLDSVLPYISTKLLVALVGSHTHTHTHDRSGFYNKIYILAFLFRSFRKNFKEKGRGHNFVLVSHCKIQIFRDKQQEKKKKKGKQQTSTYDLNRKPYP